jgi:hypothetical protein
MIASGGRRVRASERHGRRPHGRGRQTRSRRRSHVPDSMRVGVPLSARRGIRGRTGRRTQTADKQDERRAGRLGAGGTIGERQEPASQGTNRGPIASRQSLADLASRRWTPRGTLPRRAQLIRWAKALGPDGKPCARGTDGLLKRQRVTASEIQAHREGIQQARGPFHSPAINRYPRSYPGPADQQQLVAAQDDDHPATRGARSLLRCHPAVSLLSKQV